MHKRLDARFGCTGAMISVLLAGCSAQAPTTTTPPASSSDSSYQVQGGDGFAGAADVGAHGAIPQTIPVAQAPFLLHNLAYVTSHPILDYSWYYNRGNFAVFGWAPGYYATYANFGYYNAGSYYAPYAFNKALNVYQPYTSVLGGQTYYPFIGAYGNPYYSLGYPYWFRGFGRGFGFRRGFTTGRRRFTGRRGFMGGRGIGMGLRGPRR